MVRPQLIAALAGVCFASCAASPPPAAPLAQPPLTSQTSPRTDSKLALRERCTALEATVKCGPGSQKTTSFAPDDETGGALCTVSCAPNGEALRIDLATESLEERGQVSGGQRSGAWRAWVLDESLQRVLKSETHYLDGRKHGPHRTWHSNGQLDEEGEFLLGEKHGRWRRYSADGVLLQEAEFINARLVGSEREWFLNGRPRSQRVFDDLGRPDGEWCFWRVDGTLVDCFTVRQGTGRITEYDEAGKVTVEYEMKDGLYHGRFVDHVYGLSTYEAFYREGQKHGVERTFRDGCVDRETSFVDGKQAGPAFVQNCDHDPPIKVVEGQYCDDLPCGRWVERDPESGRRMAESEYSQTGELLGHIIYDTNEQIIEFRGSMSP